MNNNGSFADRLRKSSENAAAEERKKQMYASNFSSDREVRERSIQLVDLIVQMIKNSCEKKASQPGARSDTGWFYISGDQTITPTYFNVHYSGIKPMSCFNGEYFSKSIVTEALKSRLNSLGVNYSIETPAMGFFSKSFYLKYKVSW